MFFRYFPYCTGRRHQAVPGNEFVQGLRIVIQQIIVFLLAHQMDHRIARHDMYQKKADRDDHKDRHKGRRNFLSNMTGHMYVLLSHKSGRSALRPPAHTEKPPEL